MSAYGGGSVHQLCDDGPACNIPDHLEIRGGHRWKYRLVYQGGDGAMAIYWTDSRADADKVQVERGGIVQGPLGDTYWGKR